MKNTNAKIGVLAIFFIAALAVILYAQACRTPIDDWSPKQRKKYDEKMESLISKDDIKFFHKTAKDLQEKKTISVEDRVRYLLIGKWAGEPQGFSNEYDKQLSEINRDDMVKALNYVIDIDSAYTQREALSILVDMLVKGDLAPIERRIFLSKCTQLLGQKKDNLYCSDVEADHHAIY